MLPTSLSAQRAASIRVETRDHDSAVVVRRGGATRTVATLRGTQIRRSRVAAYEVLVGESDLATYPAFRPDGEARCSLTPEGDPGERTWCAFHQGDDGERLEYFDERLRCDSSSPASVVPVPPNAESAVTGRSSTETFASLHFPNALRVIDVLVDDHDLQSGITLTDGDRATGVHATRSMRLRIQHALGVPIIGLRIGNDNASLPTEMRVRYGNESLGLQRISEHEAVLRFPRASSSTCFEIDFYGEADAFRVDTIDAVTIADLPNALDGALRSLVQNQDTDIAVRIARAFGTDGVTRILESWDRISASVRAQLLEELPDFRLYENGWQRNGDAVLVGNALVAHLPHSQSAWLRLMTLPGGPANNEELFAGGCNANTPTPVAQAIVGLLGTRPKLWTALARWLATHPNDWQQVVAPTDFRARLALSRAAAAARMLPQHDVLRSAWLELSIDDVVAHNDFAERYHWITSAADCSSPLVHEYLITALDSEEWMIRAAAIHALGDALPNERVQILLQDAMPRVRSALLRAPEVRSRTIDTLRGDRWAYVRAQVAAVTEDTQQLASMTADSSAQVRTAALTKLLERRTELDTATAAVAAINTVLHDPQEWPEVLMAALACAELAPTTFADGILEVIRRGARENAWSRDVEVAVDAMRLALHAGGTLASEAQTIAERSNSLRDVHTTSAPATQP